MLEQSVAQFGTKDSFQPVNGIFGNTAPMVTTDLLPACPSQLPDSPKNLIPGQSSLGSVTMLLDAASFSRRDGSFCSPASNGLVVLPTIIGAITAYLRDGLFDRLQHLRQLFSIATIGFRKNRYQYLSRMFIYRQMQFPPGAPFTISVLPYFPFSLAKNLQAGSINYHMNRLSTNDTRKSNLQPALATTESAIIRGFQRQLHHRNNRGNQPLRRTQRQPKQGSQVQRRLN